MVSRTVLVVGGGGREHALVHALADAEGAARVLCAPGNVGIADHAELCDVPADDAAALAALARSRSVELAVVGPEAPLVAGVADALRAEGVAVLGPSAAASRLEGSKAFAKEVMEACGVPTARSITVADVASGMAAVTDLGLPVAIKADGLAAGKGVVVATEPGEARAALAASLEQRVFGEAGASVLVEEGLVGPEVSLLCVCDGRRVVRFPAARDYKPIGEGNTGPNTGGMGSVSPVPDVPDGLADELVETVHRPVVEELARRGTPFVGVLYAGLMMTADGPRVLEFNVRFGDPETQALLPLLDVDLTEVLEAAAGGSLPGEDALPVRPGAAVCVVVASEGYPASPRVGDRIDGLAEAAATGAQVYHAGTALGAPGEVVTAGGRVLGVVASGAALGEARAAAYAAADRISFRGMQLRRDIGSGADEA